MEDSELYPIRQQHLNHLEKVRYGLLAFHLGSLGYLGTHLQVSGFVTWSITDTVFLWLALSGAWLFAVGHAHYLVHRSSILLANDLHNLEMKLGLQNTAQAETNHADANQPSFLIGCMPELLSALWFFIAATSGVFDKEVTTRLVPLSGMMLFLALALWHGLRYTRLLDVNSTSPKRTHTTPAHNRRSV